ncbi:MAG: hypothetical protein HDR51_03800 [Treponema sp.]|nr:hypothetical protein [Treponema sp.]MBD5411855.1 hypothetical protein [Treponema sp.]MBD5414405.1 hypothetical protein [Treponema sp.]
MSEKYYCKWCGDCYSSIQALTRGSCNRNSGGRYHEPYEGNEKAKYCCKWCGSSYSSIQALTRGSCNKNSSGRYHEPEL